MSRRLTVLLAADKFKGCLSAADVCAELRTGLQCAKRPIEVVLRPVADGGDGTLEAALAAGFQQQAVTAAGPLGHPRPARIGVRDGTALIELAEICGMALLPSGSLQPMDSTTYGVGLAMKAAMALGHRDLVVGLGGSASTDGGMGAAVALGARVVGRAQEPVRPTGAGLADVAAVDLGQMRHLLEGVTILLATDVTSPLIGEHGAAIVFAPQKGADAQQVRQLDDGLRRWAEVLNVSAGIDVGQLPGAGAAGGFAAPFLATGCATIMSGAELMLDLTGAKQAIEAADLVITGEGSWDVQTSAGKAPQVVLEAALSAGRQVIAVAGSFSPDADLPRAVERYSLTDLAGPSGDPFRDARSLLRQIGILIANRLPNG